MKYALLFLFLFLTSYLLAQVKPDTQKIEVKNDHIYEFEIIPHEPNPYYVRLMQDSLAFARGELGNCKIDVKLEVKKKIPFRNIIYMQSSFYLTIKNNDKKKFWFPILYGRSNEKESFMTFELYQKTKRGFTEKIEDRWGAKFMQYDLNGDSSETRLRSEDDITIRSGDSLQYCIGLIWYFDIKNRGKYKLVGYYRTICDGVMTLNKMTDQFFEVD